jgi:hypothetical protein
MVRHTDTTTDESTYDRVSYDVVADGFEAGDRVAIKYESPYSGTVVETEGTATDVSASCVTVELDDGRVWGIHGRSIRTTESSRHASGTVESKNGRPVGYVEQITLTTERPVETDGGATDAEVRAAVTAAEADDTPVRTDGGNDIIVAGDDGVIIDGKCGEHGPNGERCERDDGHAGPHAAGFPDDAARRPDPEPRHVWGEDAAHPDDEGVEILPDGGGSEPTPDDLADLSDGDVVEVDTEDGDTVTLTTEDPRHPNLGGYAGNGRYSRYFARDDGKRVSICSHHEDKNDARRRDASYLINRTKTGGIMDNVDVDKREVVDWRRVETDGGHDVTVAVYHDDDEHVVGLERFESGFVALLIASSANTIHSPDVADDRVDALAEAFMSPIDPDFERDDKPVRADGGEYRCEACGDTVEREEYVAVGPTTPAAKHLGIDDPDRDHLVVCDPCFERAAEEIGDGDAGTDVGKPPGEDVSIAPNYEAGGVWFTLGNMPRRLLSPSDARAVADHVEGEFGPTPDGYDSVGDMADRLRELANEVERKVDDPHVAAFDDIPLTD